MKKGWIYPKCGKVNAPFVLSCDCKPAASDHDCVHDWVVTTYGATTEGYYVQVVCRKCGKKEQIFNSYESLVDIYTQLCYNQ